MNTPIEPAPPAPLHCSEMLALRDAYLSGALDERGARRVEAHAAGCPECGDALDGLTRLHIDAYSPVPPASARTRTLAAVRRRRTVRRAPWWGGALAAAAVLALFATGLWRERGSVPQPVPATPPVSDAIDRAATPAAIAEARSASEFQALDDAARELQRALDASPGDDELRDFLAAVRARRAELSQRVKDAAS